MTTFPLNLPFACSLDDPLLLIEITPFDILMGVQDVGKDSLSYESMNPLPFKSLEDAVQSFLNRNSIKDITSARVALSLNLETHRLSPAYAGWIFDPDLFKKELGFLDVAFIDRASAIAKAVPFLGPKDVLNLLDKEAGYFECSKETYMTTLTDQGYESVFCVRASNTWSIFKSLTHDLGIETQDLSIQSILNAIHQGMTFPEPTIDFFFQDVGIEKLYAVLYQEKGMEAYLKQKFSQVPKIIDKGAPSDIAPLDLNSPPRLSVEGLDVAIASIEPRSVKIPKNPSFLPLSLKPALSFLQENDMNWPFLRALPLAAIITGAFSFKAVPLPQNSMMGTNDIKLPPDIQKLCFECLHVWMSFLGETLGRQALVLKATGGVFLAGRLLNLMKSIFSALSLGETFQRETVRDVSSNTTPLFLILNPVPAFLGLLQFFMEQEKT